MKFSWKSWLLVLMLVLTVVLGGVGCSTTESENTSTRPWNAPKGWQFGMPGIDQMH